MSESAGAAIRAWRELRAAPTVADAFEVFTRFLRICGFNHVSFAFVAHGEIRPRFIHSTIDMGLINRALGSSAEMDPFSQAACRSTAPIIFGVDEMPASPITDMLMREGMQSMIVVPLRLHTGHLGAVYLGATASRAELTGRLLGMTGDIMLVSIGFGQRVGELYYRHDNVTIEERQALVLLAQGLEYPAIAQGMGSNVRRVRYLIERLRARLGAANKPHLIHIAHQTGLL